jgi:exosortase F-associated protein
MGKPPQRKRSMLNSLKHFGYRRILFLVGGAAGLFLVYFFQHYLDFYSLLIKGEFPRELNYSANFTKLEPWPFVLNKLARYLLNDLFTIAIIYGLFHERKYLNFSFVVLIFGLVFLLPSYLVLYLSKPEGFSSLLSHLHRIVLNPVLMMLLIPSFFYQRKIAAQKR